MLYIATDLKDPRWLRYLLEEFARLNRARFPISIGAVNEIPEGTPTLYYTKEFSSGICFPNRSHIQPDGDIWWISPDIFILPNTSGPDHRFACRYDLFWNAFVFLSRLEEYQSEQHGKKIHSYSRRHPRVDKASFEVPVVNHLFDTLEKLIKQHFPALPFGMGQNPVIELSHDVDYIAKTVQLRLKQTAFNGFNTLKAINQPAECAYRARKTVAFLFSTPSYWCFDYWARLEKSHHQRSVFYVYVQTGKKDWQSWLLDPSYDLASHPPLQHRLKQLLEEGFEVGLHGSFSSAVDGSKLAREKNRLEEILGYQVTKVRQHWLRYEERITPFLHDNLFDLDSTLGWNDRMGFRSGCASRYRPYDHEHQAPFGYQVTPQIVMDSHVFDYGADDVERFSHRVLELLAGLGQFKSAHISLAWHQRVCSADYGWHLLYEKLLARLNRS